MIDFKTIVLIFFGALAVSSAVLVVFLRNIVYSAFSLIATFFSLAVLFIFLSAEFVAGVQVLIYVGGILILFLFALMLSQQLSQKAVKLSSTKLLPAVLLALPMLGIFLFVIYQTDWELVQNIQMEEGVASLASLLLDKYLLPFELASILLLGALVGALLLARPGEK
ncbi:MAG: NADH-quinone oxidoreductase subunit J [Deltaproteobacteria bacterium]|nr:NADH-quinone oxidoreductase subunit J [Deltaproteobacteria bacterium]